MSAQGGNKKGVNSEWRVDHRNHPKFPLIVIFTGTQQERRKTPSHQSLIPSGHYNHLFHESYVSESVVCVWVVCMSDAEIQSQQSLIPPGHYNHLFQESYVSESVVCVWVVCMSNAKSQSYQSPITHSTRTLQSLLSRVVCSWECCVCMSGVYEWIQLKTEPSVF